MTGENRPYDTIQPKGLQKLKSFLHKLPFHLVYNCELLTFDETMDFLSFNPFFSRLITSYQKKISNYDKLQWERSLEDHILFRTENVESLNESGPKSSLNGNECFHSNNTNSSNNNSITNDLIDLDLISGSAYTMKSKSQQGWISMLFHAVLRVLFFPLYLKWWSEKTNPRLVGFLLVLYVLQIISIRMYHQKNFISFSSFHHNTTNGTHHSHKSTNEFAEISPTEIWMPVAMMIVLGIIHTQIVGTKIFKSSSSSAIGSTMFHKNKSRRNSSQTFSNDKLICQNHQTDCSSSSGSSTSSSVDSSPVSDVRHRVHNRMTRLEKLKQNRQSLKNGQIDHPQNFENYINEIRICNDYEDTKILLVDDQKSLMNQERNNNYSRKRTDSMPKSNLRKRKSSFRIDLKSSKSSWNYDDDNLNSSPISLRSSLYGSSCDSEGTISPMTAVYLQNGEWPTVHSDATSDVEFDECSINRNSKPAKDESSDKLPKNPSANSSNQIDSNHTQLDRNEKDECQSMNQTRKHDINYEQISSNELKASCTVWQHNVCQKIDLSVMDISSAIIRKVDTVEHSTEYIYLGIIFSIVVALIPSIYRLQFSSKEGPSIVNILSSSNSSSSNLSQSPDGGNLSDLQELFSFFVEEAFFINKSSKTRLVVIIVMIERFFLSIIYFFLLCVTERTFKQRFLYSKYFSHITRRDRAKRSQVPHFRLHKVRNLKVWLSVRSYLRRYGPHRSVDTICSTTFIISICLLTCISLQILRDSNESCTSRLICWEMIFWSLALGLYIMRLMILGSRINQKYRSNLSVLITEQINLYLQLERKPHKKDSLMLANQVLKLAVDLLKELESPYKISGFSANPYLYNITKVVVLSAFSAVLTEMLGFKLKLYKIKLIR